MNKFYDGTKLLSLKDINGKVPEIFMCTTNRSGGKTTYFNRLLVNRYLKKGEKFCLIYRYKDELDGVSEKFFGEIKSLFFSKYSMMSIPKGKGLYHELYITKYDKDLSPDEQLYKCCGYAVALNGADKLKKYSHFFSDVISMMFDEFQSETDTYCPKEVRKFKSLHTSIARGGGKQVRYVPVYMCANPVTLLNPYYTEMGIANRLHDDTVYLRGDGFVLEQGFNESAAAAQMESGFNRAFAGGDASYRDYITQGVYLNDNKAFIEKPAGYGRYMCTIRYMGKDYGIRVYDSEGVVYCDNSADLSCKLRLAVTTDDHNINFVMLQGNRILIDNMRTYFNNGCFRFRNLECKAAIMSMLAYR